MSRESIRKYLLKLPVKSTFYFTIGMCLKTKNIDEHYLHQSPSIFISRRFRQNNIFFFQMSNLHINKIKYNIKLNRLL